ncbi:DNA-binding protein [Bacillus sp. Cr_A10]|uniref:DNA-binding protein n=1 Tax=Bacillus sp. Cr_A10 TaxID=3033993 RepID=UPI0023DA28EE|nr:DNA-binding protein [Bacillus sp. Cr_A10]MDF2065107.1 DNA-binding protein [Bacillus sp. Cr_A10]
MEQTLNSFNSTSLEVELKNVIITTLEQAVKEYQHKTSQWMSLKEGASYAGVSYNTFIKFRGMGLKVCEIDGVKRVSKSAIDSFLNLHSY